MASLVCLLLQSSGQRYGPQSGQDLTFDASDLPNPSQASRQGTGKSSKLQRDFFQQPGVEEFFAGLLTKVLALCVQTATVEAERRHKNVPDEEQEDDNDDACDRDDQGRIIKVVGVSCEFGKHRSVALIERLAATLRSTHGLTCAVVHHNIDTQTTQKRQQRERASKRAQKTHHTRSDSD
jgi:RNase adaptor protein for sRNA GlmZ degradation